MNYNTWTPGQPFQEEITVSEFIWNHILPWVYGKLFSLGWTFVSSLVSYSPFLLMTVVENKLEENKFKKLQQMHIRAREDYAMEELSAYKDGDDINQYIKTEEKTQEEEEQEEEEEEEDAGEEEEEKRRPRKS